MPNPTPVVTAAPKPTPHATPKATPRATPRTTPHPAATPKAKVKAKPPCPGAVDGPPGKHKGEGADSPCGKGQAKGKDKKDKTKGGVVIILPLAIMLAGETLRRRATFSLRMRRPRR